MKCDPGVSWKTNKTMKYPRQNQYHYPLANGYVFIGDDHLLHLFKATPTFYLF